MRRHLFTQAARRGGLGRCLRFRIRLHLPVKMAQLRLQEDKFLLLTENRAVEFLDQIFHQAQADFEFGISVIHGHAHPMLSNVPQAAASQNRAGKL